MSPAPSQPHIAIRSATPADCHVLASLHAETFTEAWSQAAFGAFLANGNYATLIAESTAPPQPIGFIVIRFAADEAEIITLGVRPVARQQGVASRLLRQALAVMSKRSARRVFLEVACANLPALRTYEALDFAVVGRRPGYYRAESSETADAVIMGLEIDSD